MFYILYNPLSRSGKNPKLTKKIEKLMAKLNEQYRFVDVIEISKMPLDFSSKLIQDDKVLLVGGDGTFHHFANKFANINMGEAKIYLYRGGNGNDFGREFKEKLIDITDILHNIPYYSIDGKKELFINCTGFGIDGEVCKMVNSSTVKTHGLNYFKSAASLFKMFNRYDLDVLVDGVRYRFKKVYFATVMNGKYFGGGMKLAPDANRFDDEFELYIIHSVGPRKLLLLFPLILIGKHMWARGVGVSRIKGHSFKLEASTSQTLETDGEVIENVKEFIVSK